jgi:hypothetical protein
MAAAGNRPSGEEIIVLRGIFLTTLLLVLSSGSMAELADPLCVLDLDQMPASWRPSAKIKKTLNPAPWSQNEQKDAQYSIVTGLNEMIGFFERKPAAIQSVWADSVEALIQLTYASANTPEFDAKVSEAARKNLTTLITTYFDHDRSSASVNCDEFERLLPLTLFAHKLYPANDPRTIMVTKRTNAAYRTCGSLEVATGHDYRNILAVKQAPPSKLLEVYIWTLWFMEAELYPDIELPAEIREYGPALWKYFETYRLASASEFKEGPRDEKFIEVADLAPHIAHIATGTNRYPIYVEDNPHLYRFHRENFYAVMEVGELDLFASIVDTLRQYGCTADNDVQVRDGTRFLLNIFHKGKDRWMAYRQPGETDANIDDYGLVHYPWTSVLGVRARKPEQPEPGNVGGNIRRWLPHPR